MHVVLRLVFVLGGIAGTTGFFSRGTTRGVSRTWGQIGEALYQDAVAPPRAAQKGADLSVIAILSSFFFLKISCVYIAIVKDRDLRRQERPRQEEMGKR